MTIDIMWENPDRTALLVEVTGNVSPKQLARIAAEGCDLLNSVQREVDAIVDLTDCTALIDGAMLYAKQALDSAPWNLRCVVIISTDKLVSTATDLFKRIYRRYSHRIVLVESLSAAIRALETLNAPTVS